MVCEQEEQNVEHETEATTSAFPQPAHALREEVESESSSSQCKRAHFFCIDHLLVHWNRAHRESNRLLLTKYLLKQAGKGDFVLSPNEHRHCFLKIKPCGLNDADRAKCFASLCLFKQDLFSG